jgi:chemotaxis protein methyltransferase CheR
LPTKSTLAPAPATLRETAGSTDSGAPLRKTGISSEDQVFLATLLRRRSGLSITSERSDLVERRLEPVASRHGFKDVAELLRELHKAPETLWQSVTDAMTINDTSFFRDQVPFDRFRAIMVPNLATARQRKKTIRIWCAAASTGQEPYSLAMILEGLSDLAGWTIDILGSDINAEIVKRAKDGIYSQFEVLRGLPIQMLARHFHQRGEELQLSSAIRRRVQFRVFNLLDSYAELGAFDVIFCRNVLIYFDQQAKQEVLSRLSDVLAPDGYLVLGSAETVMGLAKNFKPMANASGIYVKIPGQPSRAAMG